MCDVFLAHNSLDKPMVRVISRKLQNLGIETWLDEEKIRPGCLWQDALQQAITEVRSAAIFIGMDGVGEWQPMELRGLIEQFIRRRIPILPVLLPGVDNIPSDLTFLRQYHAVFFRNDIEDELALENLYWGITGRKLNQPWDFLRRGEIFDSITDGTLYLDQTSQDPVKEIRDHIQQGTLISPRYIYSFPYGANLWLELCNDFLSTGQKM